MSDDSCFHNLKSGGIARQLAPGVSARVFPGVHAMLSVVTLEPDAVSPVHAHPNEQWASASRASGSASRTASSTTSRPATSGRRRRTCRTAGARWACAASCSTSSRRRARNTGGRARGWARRRSLADAGGVLRARGGGAGPGRFAPPAPSSRSAAHVVVAAYQGAHFRRLIECAEVGDATARRDRRVHRPPAPATLSHAHGGASTRGTTRPARGRRCLSFSRRMIQSAAGWTCMS